MSDEDDDNRDISEDDETRDISNVLLNGQRISKGRRRKTDRDD